MNSYQWNRTRSKPSRIARIYDVDTVTVLATQVKAINKKLDGLALLKLVKEDTHYCEGGHSLQDCQISLGPFLSK